MERMTQAPSGFLNPLANMVLRSQGTWGDSARACFQWTPVARDEPWDEAKVIHSRMIMAVAVAR